MAPNADKLAEQIHTETTQQPWSDSGRCDFVINDKTNVNSAIVARLTTLDGSPVRWLPCWAHVFDLMSGDLIAALRAAVEPLMLA
jgi:hypothetical protein